MKKIILFNLLLLALIFISSCEKEAFMTASSTDSKPSLTVVPPQPADSFRQVSHNYASNINGVNFVNITPGVQSIGGQHWVYQSPSLNGIEVGFAVYASPSCLTGDCDVVLFLHGSDKSENAGSAGFYNQYNNFHQANHPRVLIFANGILADDNAPIAHSVWKTRTYNGTEINHPRLLQELIGGIVEDSTHFPMMKKTMENWSVVGFSAGASAAMGMYMDPQITSYPQYRPQNVFPLGGWMTPSLDQYFDLYGGFQTWETCANSDVNLVIVNHQKDNVDCSGNITYNSNIPMMDSLVATNTPAIYLGINDSIRDCNPGEDSNPAHSVSFYLKNHVDQGINTVSCVQPTYLTQFTLVGDLLYRN